MQQPLWSFCPLVLFFCGLLAGNEAKPQNCMYCKEVIKLRSVLLSALNIYQAQTNDEQLFVERNLTSSATSLSEVARTNSQSNTNKNRIIIVRKSLSAAILNALSPILEGKYNKSISSITPAPVTLEHGNQMTTSEMTTSKITSIAQTDYQESTSPTPQGEPTPPFLNVENILVLCKEFNDKVQKLSSQDEKIIIPRPLGRDIKDLKKTITTIMSSSSTKQVLGNTTVDSKYTIKVVDTYCGKYGCSVSCKNGKCTVKRGKSRILI